MWFTLIPVCEMIRTYSYPNNVKRDGVCIYYKKFLSVRVMHLLSLQEALLLELNNKNKKLMISSLCNMLALSSRGITPRIK